MDFSSLINIVKDIGEFSRKTFKYLLTRLDIDSLQEDILCGQFNAIIFLTRIISFISSCDFFIHVNHTIIITITISVLYGVFLFFFWIFTVLFIVFTTREIRNEKRFT